MGQSIIYVGLDVHKDTIVVALAEAGLRGKVRQPGSIRNTQLREGGDGEAGG
jgi:transposase